METVRATIKTIEGDHAILTLSDGQLLRLPCSCFEGQPKPDLSVALIPVTLGAEDAGRTALARTLLNEILLP